MAVHMTDGYQADAVLQGQLLTCARILWDNLPGTISASSAADGRAAERAGQVDTASWWQPAVAPGWWQITYANAKVIDAVGIAAHQLAGVGVTVQAMVGGAWTDLVQIVPADRSALLLLFRAVTATAVRINIDAAALIGVIYTGRAMVMPVAGYTALGMVDLGREATLTSYVSEGGQLLKRYLQRSGLSRDVQWDNLSEDWYRASFDAFALRARTEPFFLASRPQGYPTDCAYCWVDAPIVPSRMGQKNFLSVSFTVKGHAHE